MPLLSFCSSAILSMSAMLNAVKASLGDGDLSLFVRDETSRVVPIDLPLLATVQDLHDAIVEFKQVNSTEHKVAISFQSRPLMDMDALLADIGITPESFVDVQLIPMIQLHRESVEEDLAAARAPLTLQWDVSKDISQLAFVQTMREVAIEFHGRSEDFVQYLDYTDERDAIFHRINDKQSESHSLWIVPTDSAPLRPSTFDDLFDFGCSSPWDLKLEHNARDMVIMPTDDQIMVLHVADRDGVRSFYRIPDGYSLWLQHRPAQYDPIVHLKSRSEQQSQFVEFFDTSKDFNSALVFGDWKGCKHIAVTLYNDNGSCVNSVHYKAGSRTAKSHLFFIRPIQEIQDDSDLVSEAHVTPSELYGIEYAKDVKLVAQDGQRLYAQCWAHFPLGSHRNELFEYVIPDGYGLSLKYQNPRFVPLRLAHTSMTLFDQSDLQLDVERELSQIAHIQRWHIVGVLLCKDNSHSRGREENIVYLKHGKDRADCHSFFIQSNEAIRQRVGNATEDAFRYVMQRLYPRDLRQPEYSKHLVVAPKPGQRMRFFYETQAAAGSLRWEYVVPVGYNLLLQYLDE